MPLLVKTDPPVTYGVAMDYSVITILAFLNPEAKTMDVTVRKHPWFKGNPWSVNIVAFNGRDKIQSETINSAKWLALMGE